MLQALFEKHNSFLRPWKKKGFKEERVTTVGWYDTGTSHDHGIQQEPFFYTGYQGWPVSWLRDNRPETERAAVVAAARGLEACGYDPAVRVRFQAEAGIVGEGVG